MDNGGARLRAGLRPLAAGLCLALGVSRGPACACVWYVAERPRSGVVLTDAEIREATEWLGSADRDEQFKGLERLLPYFGKDPFLWRGISYVIDYRHELTAAAHVALRKPRAVSLILRCLGHADPAMRIWAISRARLQDLLNGNMSFTDRSVRELLDAGGLIIDHDVRQQLIKAVEPLKADPDEHARAEALHLRAELSAGYGTIRTWDVLPHIDDESAVVRTRMWRLLSMACSANRGPVADRPEVKPALARLRRDIPAREPNLANAALCFVTQAGWNVRYSRKLDRPQDARLWQQILDGCEDLVTGRLEARTGNEDARLEAALFTACQWYPRSEPLLVKALAEERSRHSIIRSLSKIGTEDSLAPLRELAAAKDDEGLAESARSAIKSIEERARKTAAGLSFHFFTPQYLDVTDPDAAEVYRRLLGRHGLGAKGHGTGTTLQIYDTPENGHRWRVLMTILDTPAWEKAFREWDGSDLLQGVKLEWRTQPPPAEARPDAAAPGSR